MTSVVAPSPDAEQQVHDGAETAHRWRSLWWATPLGCIALVLPVSLLISTDIPGRDYLFYYRVQKDISGSDTLLFLLAGGVLAVGTVLPLLSRRPLARGRWPGLTRRQLHTVDRCATVSFWLTVMGYVLFTVVAFSRGATLSFLLQTVTSQNAGGTRIQTLFAPIAGVTSFTQVGVAYLVLAGILRAHGVGRNTGRRLAIVFALALVRAYFLTERLAILELAVPLIIIAATRARQGSWAQHRTRVTPYLPLVAVPVLLLLFGAFEYSRSWQYYKLHTTQSYPEFTVNRLAGYYATSYNNGSLLLRFGSHVNRLPYESIQGLWTAPGIAQLHLYNRLTGTQGPAAFDTVLSTHGNPEFNNPGGLAVPFFDFGVAGGFLFFLVAGVVVGMAFRSFRDGNVAGLLFYPVLFTGLLEIPRYVYWTEGRVVPAYVMLAVTAYLARPRRKPG